MFEIESISITELYVLYELNLSKNVVDHFSMSSKPPTHINITVNKVFSDGFRRMKQKLSSESLVWRWNLLCVLEMNEC